MTEQWQQGTNLFLSLRPQFQNDPERIRDIDLVEALGIQFKSGRNILRFYHLRSLLINGRTQAPLDVLESMRSLVEEEIEHSERMAELCEQDSRLGFHSEAETYKYYPAKLRWRIEQLKELLSTEFPETRHLLETGISMPDWAPDRMAYRYGEGWRQGVNFRWRIDVQEGNLMFRAECQAPEKREYSIIDFHLIDKAGIQNPWRFRCSPEISASDSAIINISWGDIIYGERSDSRWSVKIVIPGLSWDMEPAKQPTYFSVTYILVAKGSPTTEESWPPVQGARLSRLALSTFDPENMARLEDGQ
jgi:hypothetical protein